MKKLVVSAAAVFLFSFANAQETYKPSEGTVTTEVALTGGLNNANFGLNGGGLKFRYFLKDALALRFGVGVTNVTDEDISGSSPNKVTDTEKNNDIDFKFGIEKHFAGSDRLSTYAGADLVIGFGKISDEEVEEGGDYEKFSQKNATFGLNLLTGADYYIAKKLYIGVEAGLSFGMTKFKDEEFSQNNGGVVTSNSNPGSKRSNLFTSVIGGVRIGYQF